MAETIVLHQGYGSTGALYSNLDDILNKAADKLADVDFDTMVGTGMSGSIVIPLLAKALGKNFLIIRKDGAGAHTDSHVGRLGGRWIFVDDFVSSGSTRDRVVAKVNDIVSTENRYRYGPPQFATEWVGSYLYASYPEPAWCPNDDPKTAGLTGCQCPACKGAEPF